MKNTLTIAAILVLVYIAGVFAEADKPFRFKKFELKSDTASPTSSTTPTEKKSFAEESKIILPPLPAGQKRVDINVIQEEFYECPKCGKEFAKTAKCPEDGTLLIRKTRSFTYKCKICGYMNEKAGKCPVCKSRPALKKFEVSYQDVGCKVIASEPGLCPKCQQPLKKNVRVEIKD